MSKRQCLCTLLINLMLALRICGADRGSSVVDVVPTLAELGGGWTTNLIVSVTDPLTQAASKQTQPATNELRKTSKPSGQTGWGRFQYGRGDMLLNRGAYFVTVQRWATTNALESAWKRWTAADAHIDRTTPGIGEAAFWKRDEKFVGLTFRRGLFHVVISCGAKSDRAGIIQLAELTDAKILGRQLGKGKGPAGTPATNPSDASRAYER